MLLPQSVIRIALDVRDVEKQLSFAIKQNDSVRRLIVTLTDKGKPYLIGIGCYAVFSATTSKNTVISNGCQIKNNEIIYDLSETDTAVVGRMDAEITLFGSNGEEITSPNFTINVYKSKIGDYAGEVVASDDFSTLKNLISETNTRIAKIDEILESDGKTIDDAVDQAIHDIDTHAADVVDSLPDTYVEVANDVAKVKKEVLARPTGTLVIDEAEGYIKTVPGNSLPIAKINKVGGKTFKDGSVLKPTKATGIESMGVNLFDQAKWFENQGFTLQRDGSHKGESINVECFRNASKRSGPMYISYEGKTSSGSTPLLFCVYYTDGTSAYIGGLSASSAFTKIIAQTISYKTVDYIFWSHANGADYYVKNVMISFVDSEYTPYKRETILIPEAIRNLDGYGEGMSEEYQNYIDLENKQYVQNVKKVVFDGSDDEGITVELIGADYTMFNLQVSGGYDYSRAVSNYDIPFRVGYDTNDAHFYVSTKFVSVSMPVGIGRTVAEFKEYLRKNPLHVVYRLASPIITDISDILSANNFIEVAGGGTLTFVNEHGYGVPSEVEYYINAVSGVMVSGTPALKVGDTIIEEARLKMILEAIKKSIIPVSKIGTATLLASAWKGNASPYSQVVNINGVTANSQVDLTPSADQLAVFHDKDLAFVTENDDGVVTVYAIGQKPTNDYTIQVTITEVYA